MARTNGAAPFLTTLALPFHLLYHHSLQAIVYFSVRAEKEGLNGNVLTTELFGMSLGEDEAPYVYAGNGEEEMAKAKEESPAGGDEHNTIV